jgi:hypothetical protein
MLNLKVAWMADTKRQENIKKILLKNLLQFNGIQVS